MDNRQLPLENIVPWDEYSNEIISKYQSNQAYFDTYHISYMFDSTHNGDILDIFDRCLKSINIGDFIWVNVRTCNDKYNIDELGGFAKISSEIYLYQNLT